MRQCLRGIELPRQEAQLARSSGPEQPLQGPGEPEFAGQSDLQEGGREPCPAGRHPQIARRGPGKPRSGATAIDGSEGQL